MVRSILGKMLLVAFGFFLGVVSTLNSDVHAGSIDATLPDAIICDVYDTPNKGIFYYGFSDVTGNAWVAPSTTGYFSHGDTTGGLFFNFDGTFNSIGGSWLSSGGDCDGYDITDLESTGQTIDFSISSSTGGTTTTNVIQSFTLTAPTTTPFSADILADLMLVFAGSVVAGVWIFRQFS